MLAISVKLPHPLTHKKSSSRISWWPTAVEELHSDSEKKGMTELPTSKIPSSLPFPDHNALNVTELQPPNAQEAML